MVIFGAFICGYEEEDEILGKAPKISSSNEPVLNAEAVFTLLHYNWCSSLARRMIIIKLNGCHFYLFFTRHDLNHDRYYSGLSLDLRTCATYFVNQTIYITDLVDQKLVLEQHCGNFSYAVPAFMVFHSLM